MASQLSSDPTFKAKNGSFQALGFSKEILQGIFKMGYKVPTPIQRKTLPIAMVGMDIVCMARTGSGKTAVFLLPMVHKLKAHSGTGCRAVVLSPTRELAMQTFKFAKDFAKFTDLRIISIVGGDSIETQFEELSSKPDVIIATPGRLMHQLSEISTFKLSHVQYLVFDEADRLFEMGFAEQLNSIIKQCPVERQTLLFSATMPKMIIQFTRAGLRDPQLIRLDTDIKMSEELRLGFFTMRSNEKIAALLYLIRKVIPRDQLTVIFTATRHHSELLHALLQHIQVSSTVVYGSMDQDARQTNLRAFRNGEVSYLIVTDLAARGIDVPLLNNVINFHFPANPKLFVHRCGRAARQGRIGYAFSLVEPDEMAYLVDVYSFLDKKICVRGNESVEKPVSGSHTTELVHGNEGGQDSYTLETMTPELVHVGMFPQDVLDEENDFVKRVLIEDDALLTLNRIAENGMMQYKRTRTEATRDGIRRIKLINKNNSIRSIHPLIAGCDPKRCDARVQEKANFVRLLQGFRPAQTVFESGIGMGTGSHVAKGIAKQGSKESHGAEMMRVLRKANNGSLERNRVKLTGKLGGDEEEMEGIDLESDDENEDKAIGWAAGGGDDEDGLGVQTDEYDEQHDRIAVVPMSSFSDDMSIGYGSISTSNVKNRLSIAEKRKLKRKGCSQEQISQMAAKKASSSASDDPNVKDLDSEQSLSAMCGPSSSFKDNKYYMTYGNEDERATYSEDTLQPQSGLRTIDARNAQMLENAILDLSPDDAIDMNNKRRVMRWDAKKRKFVKQSLEEIAASKKSIGNKIRTDSGAIVNGSSRPKGEMYEKWKKKTRREITSGSGPATVSFDDNSGGDDDRPRPNVFVNSHVKDELRSSNEIRKIHDKKSNSKVKNMSKDKRTKLEHNNRLKKKESQSRGPAVGNKHGNKKLRAIVRY